MSSRALPPNVVLFLSDDHAPWTLPCYGNTEVRSPTFNRMAENGTLFSNAFTPSPVCSPARACLLTGRLPSQHGVHDWISMDDPECQERDWLANEVTLAQLLSKNGYHCGLSGKWHLGMDSKTPRGYAWYFGYPDFPAKDVHIGKGNYVLNGELLQLHGNRTEITTNRALDFLDTVPGHKPFFLQIGYIATHSPYVGQDPELVESYADASFRDIEQSERPHPWAWNEDFPERHPITHAEARLRHQNQYAAVTDIDRNIGRLLDRLTENGQMENTIVIYTSDHGLSLGQHGFWGKGNGTRPLNLYDISCRVPLLFFGQSIRKGVRISACVDHLDTFATLQELCNISAPSLERPGKSYRDLLCGRKAEWDDTTFSEYGEMRAIRTPEFKLVKRYSDEPDELFDLSADPLETTNLSGAEAVASERERLERELEAYFRTYSDPVKSGLNVRTLPRHNRPQKPSQTLSSESWRDGIRETRRQH